MELHLPVLALMDSDPHGVKILSVYGCGKIHTSAYHNEQGYICQPCTKLKKV